MTAEEIERILQTVAENQVKHDEMHARHSASMAELNTVLARHSADIVEIDNGVASVLGSQNRYDERLALVSEIMHDLADKQLRNEERFAETDKRFAELAAAQMRYEARQEKLEGSYELLESFVRDFRNETRDHFAETDKRLAEFINETNKRFAGTDEQLKALIAAQARTDEQIRSLLDRNGSTTAPKTKVKKAKKTGKKASSR